VEWKGQLDFMRLAAVTVYGFIVQGPLGHAWLICLDEAVSLFLHEGTLWNLVVKVVGDSIIELPLHVVLFFAWMEMFNGNGFAVVALKVRHEFWPTYIAELLFWPAFQLINFWKVPVKHQLLAINIACIFDSTFLCWAHTQASWLETLHHMWQKNAVDMPELLVESTAGALSVLSDWDPLPLDTTRVGDRILLDPRRWSPDMMNSTEASWML